MHVDVGVVDNGISHQRVHHTFQVTHAAIDGFSNIANDLSRNFQAVTTTLGIEDIDTKLYRRLLQLSDKTAGETCQHTLVQPFQVDWRTVAGEDNLLAQTEQVVEDMEERSDGLLSSSPLLYVVNNQHIDGLIEIDEVVDRVLSTGIGKLHLEQAGTDIEYALLRIHLLATHTDGVDEVRLATARGTIDKEGVERRLAWMLSDGETHRSRELVGIALDEVLEGLLGIQLRVQSLRNSSIECRGRLIATCNDLRAFNLCGHLTFHNLGGVPPILLTYHSNNTVAENDTGAIYALEYLS